MTQNYRISPCGQAPGARKTHALKVSTDLPASLEKQGSAKTAALFHDHLKIGITKYPDTPT